MSEQPPWDHCLDEFLHYVRDTTKASDPDNVVATLRSTVRRWITFALERQAPPGERNDSLLDEWVTRVLDIEPGPQGDYRARVRRWWRWMNSRQTLTDSEVSELDPRDKIARLVAVFRADTEYPNEADFQHLNALVRHERVLRSLGEMSYEDREEIKPVWAKSNQNYGWSGQQPSLDRAVNNADEESWIQIRNSLVELCFGSTEPLNEDELIHVGARGKGYVSGSCGASDDHRSIWGAPKCNCGSQLTYKTITAGGRKLRAEKHCKETGAFIWQGQPVNRQTSVVQRDWVPRGGFGERIDDAVRSVSGLGYIVATRLPAICHPAEFIPIYFLRQVSDEGRALGKLDMIEFLEESGLFDIEKASEAQAVVQEHTQHGDSGAILMRSNDLLLETLRPYFVEDDTVDTWGIARFLYWLTWDYAEHDPIRLGVGDADLAALADDLLCEAALLEDIVELLEDKGQVILYGPPGTGKTHFAQELAWTLALTNDEAYSLVQFHPSYSYEDFFEGFRPQVDRKGQMIYELTPGPLVRLAERAAEHPDEPHFMVIDEINRANLPRVLGELLYLLEYRSEDIHTQYRSGEKFSLPENLWFIGTMNTADRSIALIDAAMRRRFHFVPFFPNRPPTQGLLRSWTQKHAPGQLPIADLLGKVNDELEQALGGDHLLIGPSHFMKRGLDTEGLRRIWEYNIEPLIEDQLFGQKEVISRFRFDAVWKRHGPAATSSGAESEGPPRVRSRGWV